MRAGYKFHARNTGTTNLLFHKSVAVAPNCWNPPNHVTFVLPYTNHVILFPSNPQNQQSLYKTRAYRIVAHLSRERKEASPTCGLKLNVRFNVSLTCILSGSFLRCKLILLVQRKAPSTTLLYFSSTSSVDSASLLPAHEPLSSRANTTVDDASARLKKRIEKG